MANILPLILIRTTEWTITLGTIFLGLICTALLLIFSTVITNRFFNFLAKI